MPKNSLPKRPAPQGKPMSSAKKPKGMVRYEDGSREPVAKAVAKKVPPVLKGQLSKKGK